MLCYIKGFEKMTPSTIKQSEIKMECGQAVNVYTIESVHDLSQFIGFGKYKNKERCNVFIRGQVDLYDGSLIPSLYRNKQKNTENQNTTDKFNHRINLLKENVASLSNYDKILLEPLLQHYGVKTPYIDVVDNVWVALWFALHTAKVKQIGSHEYVYYYNNDHDFSYILLIASDAINNSEKHGVYEGKDTVMVDLRKSLPSIFLRPHAQHAYMIKKKSIESVDYSDLVIGIAKIPTELGLRWLGNNEFLTVSSLFPAAYFDTGYSLLLRDYLQGPTYTVKQYGSIQIITD